MAEESGGEKSLPASAQKIQRAREEGNIAKSQDLSSAFALSVALAALYLLGQDMFEKLIQAGRYYFANAHLLAPEETPLLSLMLGSMRIFAEVTAPFALVMLVSGVLLNYMQVGIVFTTQPLMPKLSRIDPISGFQRFGSVRTVVEMLKSIAKLLLVTLLVWFAMAPRLPEIVMLMQQPPYEIVREVADLVFAIWWRVALAMLLLGLADFGFQRWQHLRDLRMTEQEARQESRELEGDPQIKRRIRQLQRQLATQRMMAEVPKADVIITNPVRFAVALRYDAGNMAAPEVVAKGERLIAQRIREIAVEHRVPIVQRPELARAIYRTIGIGQAVPEHLFRAVAEVLSFVYKVDRRQEKIRERRTAGML
ncbi:MAG: flagellar biosynthesis protein FlhB [Candidatus Hydrogenedentes bacterium]|nr:flagellar biosynthesis protein FlhB [Candidatus Hydrogenedentota bacterium]